MPTRSSPPRPKPDVARSSESVEPTQELRSFGRRRGRTLTARQASLLSDALPRFALNLCDAPPASLPSLFPSPVKKVWLEIGFGGAEHLIWQASEHRDVGLIGCEVFADGVVKALSGLEAAGLDNVRIHGDDARDLLRWLPPGSLDRVFILFPDPWPKKRHVKRRLVSPALLSLLARAMAPGAELRIATDIGDYARTMLLALSQHPEFVWMAKGPQDWRVRPPDWPETRYEAKAKAVPRRCYYFRFAVKGVCPDPATIGLPSAS